MRPSGVKPILGIFLLGILLFSVTLGVFGAPKKALANNPAATVAGLAIDAVIVGVQAAIAADSAVSGGSAGTAAARTAEETGEKIVDPIFATVVREVLMNTMSFIMDRLAYDAAVALSSGAAGQQPLIEYSSPDDYFRDLGLDIAGEAIDTLGNALSDALNMKFDLCAPEDPIKRLSLQIGLKQAYTRREPKCEFQDLLNNWEAVVGRWTGEPGGTQQILRQFGVAYNPGSNELSASIELNLKVHQEVALSKDINFKDRLSRGGFKSVTDVITGQITTPSELLRTQSETAIVLAKNEYTRDLATSVLDDEAALKQMGLSAISIFANTLLSGLANNLFKGLFNPQIADLDPFHPQASISGGRERAEATFRSILAPPILSFADYNIMNEFVICPGDDLRGLNSCVMDQPFATAVARAKTGTPFTVEEAIDEGLLHGSWPLIPSGDEGRNQDPRCYTYGYCYANLVKLRKARILPVGWELAADSAWNDQASPVTLQTVVDGFFSCNDQGEADDAHPWCHLIDPNWVLKIPPAQCRAFVPGELPVSGLVNARQSVCVDSPSCIAQDASGACVGGYGYCTEEKNVWQFTGDTCPAEYAGCLAFSNVRTGDSGSFLLNTVDTRGCTAENPGCRWYRTNKYEDDKGTPVLTDDTFEFLPTGESYLTAVRDASVALGSLGSPTSYGYSTDTDPANEFTYANYAFEDRLYVNQNMAVCTSGAAGCTELIPASSADLNMLANPSFEDDEDEDGEPDGWSPNFSASLVSHYDATSGNGFDELAALKTGGTTLDVVQSGIALSPSRFYTFSFYVKTVTAGSSPTRSAFVELVPQTGAGTVDLSGTTVLGECAVSTLSDDTVAMTFSTTAGEGYARHTCTFTTPPIATYATVGLTDVSGPADVSYYDALQLELGSLPTTFREGYGTGQITRSYLTVPPAWLGCTGALSDPAECASYTQMCTAQDVGCDLYTPTAGGFGVPAVTSATDSCPAECVGYETYHQEATPYESEDFPLYFIAGSADACTMEDVGCDSYTNLDEVAEGGEGIEYYSELRFCANPAENAGSTFYTWEGTESEGFQLRSWQFLESNLSDTADTTYFEASLSGNPEFIESDIGRAPCTQISVGPGESDIACDDAARAPVELDTFTDCNEHDDILTNPDCREFYDGFGNIHYRLMSQTVVISPECAPYRKNTEGTQLDCENNGGLWTSGGFCRYFVLGSESQVCSATAAGCRAYTGASGRNASTIFQDIVEDGSLDEWSGTNPNVTLSDDSLAAGGHSIRVTGGDLNVLSLVEGASGVTVSVSGVPVVGNQCAEGVLCTLEDAGGSSCQVLGTSANNTDDCGPMVDNLIQGKTYVLRFWAKGSGVIRPLFSENRGAGPTRTIEGFVTLTPQWQLYEIGPLDTSAFATFDDTAILKLVYSSGSLDYVIDNIQLLETEENLALIKNSWVTPSVCDLSPTGTPSPQHYLGCQAYTDTAGASSNLYQFTRLCSERVIGCSAFFDTQNSESVFGEVRNATCALPTGSTPVTSATDCTLDSETVCTIAPGNTSCHFDVDGALETPLPSAPFVISLGPEARVVPNDGDLFLVDNGTTSCSAAVAGCTEVGLPEFNQTKSAVTGFEATYVIDDPDTYDQVLCDTEGLFCEAWNTTADGTFYFKDPADQTCEFKTGVTLGTQQYSGWFRAGTSNPCYFTDADSDGVFDAPAELASAYLVNGIEFGIWRNGDLSANQYDGWLGQCPSRYDRCSEFVDPVDTSDGLYPNGTPYVYLKNDKLEDGAGSGRVCNGQVSLNEGCALFFDAVQPELFWNASASYIVSEHADLLFGDAEQSLQSPISCAGSVVGNDIGQIATTSGGVLMNVCQSRCRYIPEPDLASGEPGSIEHPYVDVVGSSYYTGSCVEDTDCPILRDTNLNTVSGSCVQAFDSTPSGIQPPYDANLRVLSFNDVNDVRSVRRDRECSEWLTCSSTIQVWDERTGRSVQVCDQIGSCEQYSTAGDATVCSRFSDAPPTPLSADRYVSRDVSWWGTESSGYAIPDNIPTHFLDQININPPRWCSNDHSITCTEATEATDCGSGTCTTAPENMRLAYRAGTCNSAVTPPPPDAVCYVGTCAASGAACSSSAECDTTTGEDCVIGFCENTQIGVTCNASQPCAAGFTCENSLCKQQTTTACSPASASACATGSPTIFGQCILEETAFAGGCYVNQCLLSVGGEPFVETTQNGMECRGYPEQNSPYPHVFDGIATGIVTRWADPDDPSNSQLTSEQLLSEPLLDTEFDDWIPYTKRPGYQGITLCAPDGEDCQCTYKKVQYGKGVATRYYDPDFIDDLFLGGICFGGDYEGRECANDAACNCPSVNQNTNECITPPAADAITTGRCVKPSSVETMLGLDGYCLERDTAMNKWGDSDNRFGGECLTWLPVDQLTGSTDIFNNFTEAGALWGQDVLYCTESTLFADLYVTGSTNPGGPDNQIANGCAESQTDGGNPACDEGEMPDCAENAHCPKGYFAVVGSCDIDSLPATADNCQTGDSDTTGSDDDCPYFCVPDGAQDYTGGSANCSETAVMTFPMENNVPTESWFTDAYKVGSSFAAYLEQYRHCAKLGAEVPTEYQRMTTLAQGGPNIGFWQGNADIPYLGCKEFAQVGNADEGNKAWTNRLWEDTAFALQNTADATRLSYTVPTIPEAPFGRIGQGVLTETTSGWERPDASTQPVVVSACEDDPSANQYAVAPVAGACTAVTPLGEARSYEYLSASIPELTGFASCSTQASCNNTNCITATANLACFKKCNPASYPSDFGNGDGDYGSDGSIDDDSTTTSVPSGLTGCFYDPDENGFAGNSLGECVPLAATNPNVEPNNSFAISTYVCEMPISYDGCGDDDADMGVPLTATNNSSYPNPGRGEYSYCSGDGYNSATPGNTQAYCGAERACWSQACVGTTGQKQCIPWDSVQGITLSLNATETSPADDSVGPADIVRQIFAKVLGLFRYQPSGIYTPLPDYDAADPADVSEDPSSYLYPAQDPASAGIPPIVRGLGDCFAGGCQEADDDTVTVNGVTSGTILDADGSAHVSLQFFAESNANQLPIRYVIVNWGDGHDSGATGGGYYKNHRGLQSNSQTESICELEDDWGTQESACDPSYFTFTHDYVCNTQLLSSAGLPECDPSEDTPNGCRTTDNRCRYIPRVHVQDNWGYCTGECGTAAGSPAGVECYDDGSGAAGWAVNECELACDGDSPCLATSNPLFSGQTFNPWVSFDGQVLVEP